MRSAVFAATLVIATTLASSCGDPNSCQNATGAIEDSITAVCKEPAFANTPFCRCCVPAGRFSIDDTCTCQPLVYNADFCYYKQGSGGYPEVRAALQYATSVCLGRPVAVPFGSGDGGDGMCIATTTNTPSSADAAPRADVGRRRRGRSLRALPPF